jgi:glycerol-3-phosphate dehydrogenase (NAD(P)+)
MSDTVAIVGAGAWGTALAVHLAGVAAPPALRLWARDSTAARAIAASRENSRYLPGIAIPSEIDVDFELSRAIAGASLIIVATPIGALTGIVQSLRTQTKAPLAWLGKGFVAAAEAPGVALAHRVIAPMWPAPVGVISGPSFAEEVARRLPTAISVAATEPDFAQSIAQRLRGDTLRAYVSDDLTGTEVGGAVKNVLAIAAGASDGLGFGNNARAALITRGLAETARLAVALGGRYETLTGLSGLGDLVLTCTGDLSRNRRVGLGLGRGEALAAILAALGHVAEGVSAAQAVHTLAAALRVDMPICEAVYRVLYEDLPPRRAVEALLAREPGPEFH